MTGSFKKMLTILRKHGPQPFNAGDTIKVQLYGKRDCHLCFQAKEVLSRVRKEIPFDFQEIDIESSKDLYAEFKERIPVVFIGGKQAFMYKINEKRLKRMLTSASADVDSLNSYQ